MKEVITPTTWKAVMQEHDAYWDLQRQELRLYRLAYEQRYWDRGEVTTQRRGQTPSGLLLIETSRMYEFVEGYQASLFAKEPAVIVKGDIRGRGNAEVAQAAANYFLARSRTTIEDASRMANLYPFSALKLAVEANPDPYRRVVAVTVPAWDVVVDVAASTWETQRYVGHRYWVSVHEAKQRWGDKKYLAMERVDFLDRDPVTRNPRREKGSSVLMDELHQFIQVVEVYDLVGDRLLVWSPQWQGGDRWLDDGQEVEVDGIKTKYDRIPFRTVDDAPVVPLHPLYYSRRPDQPLRGIAPARRIYDQVQEINIARTFQANGTRKAARQWIVRKGAMDEDTISKIVQGVDGEIVEVDPGVNGKLEDVMIPIPHAPTPPEVEQYIQQVQADLDRGSVLAPFTRGEATRGATATEVTALASYSASEIGRLARERDGLIEGISRIYTAILSLYVEENGNDIIWLGGKATVIKPSDLQGDFTFFAQDGGATPISEAARKADLLNAVPLLLQLGVPQATILQEIVRTLNLPESFIPEEAPAPASSLPNAPGAPAPGMPTTPPGGPQVVPDAMLGIAPGANPSPEQISQVLPSGGV